MTEQFSSPTPPTGPTSQEPVSQADLKRQAREAKAVAKANRSWVGRHKFLTGLGVAGVLVVGSVAVNSGGDEPATSNPPAAAAEAAPAADVESGEAAAAEQPVADVDTETAEQPASDAESETSAAEPKSEASSGTVSQANALESAEDYLSYSAFSKQGLIDQLEFEDYSTADAKYAVNHVDVDWNEQAAKSAKSYMDYSSFSRSGLVEQLEFEGYTSEQAEHGADAVGL